MVPYPLTHGFGSSPYFIKNTVLLSYWQVSRREDVALYFLNSVVEGRGHPGRRMMSDGSQSFGKIVSYSVIQVVTEVTEETISEWILVSREKYIVARHGLSKGIDCGTSSDRDARSLDHNPVNQLRTPLVNVVGKEVVLHTFRSIPKQVMIHNTDFLNDRNLFVRFHFSNRTSDTHQLFSGNDVRYNTCCTY